MNFEDFYKQYKASLDISDRNQSHHIVRKLVGSIVSKFPRDNPEALSWFSMALQDNDRKWFAIKILSKVLPIPSALFDDLVLAALLESNASLNGKFVEPCVNTFGAVAVKARIMDFATLPRVISNEGVNKALYFVRDVAGITEA